MQDNARQTVGRLSEVLTGALGSIKQMSYWLGSSLCESVVAAQHLQEMTARSGFDYMRYADAEGVNLAADGKQR